ncbi:MAG: hypothetical protein Q7S18_00610, partial [bacterium]|nr:hypothetical protein [bacterium]
MWQIALFLVGFPVVLVVISFSILKLIEKHKGEKLKKWAEENGLRYVGRVASSVHLLEGRIQDIIWGTYKGKRIFIFKFSGVEKASILSNAELYKYTRSDIIIVGYLFINGYFYKPGFGYHIDKEKIDSLINNESVKKIEQVGVSEFGNDKIWEHIMFVIAHLF